MYYGGVIYGTAEKHAKSVPSNTTQHNWCSSIFC